MILSAKNISILSFNKRAQELGSFRFDKGSSSSLIPSNFNLQAKEIMKSMTGLINSYPNENGLPELLDLICQIEEKTNKRKIDKNQICLTNGVISGMFLSFAALIERSEKVIINDLSFEGFSSVLLSLGLNPVAIDYSKKENLEKAIKEKKIKALILNSPENPSGKIYQEDFMEFLSYLTKKYGVMIFSDEVNNQNIYPPYLLVPPCSYISLNYLITLNSFSKNFFLPGIRLGWIVANENIIKKIKNIFSASQVAINYPSQIIALHVAKNCEKEIIECKKDLLEKKILTEKILTKEGFEFLNPVKGGSVFFVNTKVNATVLAENLLKNEKIAVVPGDCFGKKWKNWIRLGFGSVKKEEIEENIPKIKKTSLNLK